MSDNDNESDTIIKSRLAYHHDTISTINSKSHITLMTIVMMMMMLLLMMTTTTMIPTDFTTGVMSLILGNTDFSNNIIVTMSIIMSILNNYSADVQDIL
jgi:hypothetical protein